MTIARDTEAETRWLERAASNGKSKRADHRGWEGLAEAAWSTNTNFIAGQIFHKLTLGAAQSPLLYVG